MSQEAVVFSLFFALIVGGVTVIVAGLRHHGKMMELLHRERLAMIERGLVPPIDPSLTAYGPGSARNARSSRLLSAGIGIVGLGLGVALLLAFAAREPGVAAGVGGGIAAIGAALIVTGYLVYGGRSGTAAPQTRQSPPADPNT